MYLLRLFTIVSVLCLASLCVKGQHFYGRYYIDVSEKIIGRSAQVLKDSLGYFLKDTTGTLKSSSAHGNHLLSYVCQVDRYIDKSAVSIYVFVKFNQNLSFSISIHLPSLKTHFFTMSLSRHVSQLNMSTNFPSELL